ncbi:MAG: hypothetical protein QW404_02500 [Candidatus Nanoarchaeia archaeon]
MKIFRSKHSEFHVSDDLIKEFEEDVGCFDEDLNIEMVLEDFVKGDIKEYVSLYSKLSGLKGFGLLYAHGQESVRGWRYTDKGKSYSVQGWVNNMDGRFNALVIDVCNPNSRGVHSKKSLIIAPNQIYSSLRQDIGDVQVELFVPKIGYLDSYIFEEELESLRRKIS